MLFLNNNEVSAVAIGVAMVGWLLLLKNVGSVVVIGFGITRLVVVVAGQGPVLKLVSLEGLGLEAVLDKHAAGCCCCCSG